MTFKGELLPFQKEGVEYATRHHYSINACEMGLGKTIQAIAWTVRNLNADGRALVVCPAYLRRNWEAELDKFWPGHSGVTIMSYHVFTKRYDRIHADLAIFDEAHYLKNPKAKRTKAAHYWVKVARPDRLLLLTGTPVTNRVPDFWSLLKLCSRNPWDTSGVPLKHGWWRFAHALTYPRETPFGTVYEGMRNLPVLKKYLEGKYFRRTAEEELDLPPVIHNNLTCDIPDLWGDGVDPDDIDHIINEATGNPHISTAKAASAEAKASFSAEYAMDILTQDSGPVLIFTAHVAAAEVIHSMLIRCGKKSALVTGATTMDERAETVNRFQFGQVDVLVATIGSMNTGWTLTRTNRVIFNDQTFVPADNAQALARAVRIGQERTVFVTWMTGGAVDSLITNALRSKMQVISQIV